MDSLVMALFAASSGVFAHLAIFRRGEWDVASPSIFVVYVSFLSAAVLLCRTVLEVSAAVVFWVGAYHALGLYGSMLLYRGFFHRLGSFPGPFPARFTNFYITARSMKKLHLFEEVQKLHAEHGDYVRLGELSPLLYPALLL